jgi:peptidoglycan/LPS O-acetylase OafA/YrhL
LDIRARGDQLSDLSSPAATTAYRADIDGLRAIAVLGVVAFHAFPRTLGGGFTGVDIFFVISGFLISGLIFHDLQRERFTFRRFYARRFRRIFPALIVVLTAGLIYGGFALAPDEYRELGKQAAAGAGFVSNILQWDQSGYFDQRATSKPLLHLWSLGVEEQFYFAWPIIIIATFGRATRLLYVCCGLILASFIACVALTPQYSIAAFYLPMMRFWELLLGALLAYGLIFSAGAKRAQRALPRAWNEPLAWLGLLLILASLVLINRERAFPGWWALLPALGTALLVATPQAWFNRTILANRALVYIGLISYPLYLWHWVLFTFVRIANDAQEPPKFWRVLAIAAAFLLAWLTFEMVEKPIRFTANRDAMPRALIACMAACAALAGVIYLSNGLAFRFPPEIRRLAAFNYDQERKLHEAAYRDGVCFGSFAYREPQCVDEPARAPQGASPLVVLWGDSHAASLYPGLRAEQERRGFRIAQFTSSACLPLIDVKSEHRARCRDFNDGVIERLAALRPDVILLEAHWAVYVGLNGLPSFEAAALRETVQKLEGLGIRRIVVMGGLPTWKIYEPRAAFKIWSRLHRLPERSSEYLDREPFAADIRVRQALSGTPALFFSPMAELCKDGACLLSADAHDLEPVAWDNDHLSIAGSDLLIRRASDAILGERKSGT